MPETPPAARAAHPVHRPWRRRIVLLLAALLLALWALPPVVARSPALDLLARRLGARLQGSVRIGGASLGWFSAVVLRDLELYDASGRRLVAVAEIESNH